MKLNIFAVRDQKTAQYGNPMFLVTPGQAIRSFADETNNTQSDNLINKHPEDYALFQLGDYDTETGLFETHAPRQIALAQELTLPKQGR